ncbi:MAG: YebC/PmpR family DNA-binding transcriptional regulator [Oscillospiraceae bacterium]|nr:YebC/PmpR family DNA-binding transcriptional regulator [Oscillospiraceae bacterium]
MAGHSKWNNIKRRKEKTDAQKAKVFTKIGREISVAVREGGADPNSNGKLRDLIAKAKSNNVPNENIERLIKKAGDSDKDSYEAITYEGYGPAGVAIMVSALTDNRNRTAGDLRHYFDKCGGNLGQNGCVSFLFAQKGIIVIENNGLDEEKLLLHCMDAGASDINFSEDAAEIIIEPQDFPAVRRVLEEEKYIFASAQLEYIPSTFTTLGGDAKIKMEKLMDMLDDNDDVQDYWHNWEE